MYKTILHIPFDKKGIFVERVNKFLGVVNIDGNDEFVHIHDPGRLQELLYPGNFVLIKHANNPKRKTKFDLVAAKQKDKWIIVNSSYHRKIAEAILNSPTISPFKKIKLIKPEQKFGNSRLDFYIETKFEKIWVEVKGCTLLNNTAALFPDAPTKRGVKHIEELIHIKKLGFSAALLILIFPPARCFKPNIEIDKKFTNTFVKAINAGVKVYPFQLEYQIFSQDIKFKGILPICEK